MTDDLRPHPLPRAPDSAPVPGGGDCAVCAGVGEGVYLESLEVEQVKFKWRRMYATERIDCFVDGRYEGHIAGRRSDRGIDYVHMRWGWMGYVSEYWRLENSPQKWTIWIPERDDRGCFTGTVLTDYREWSDEDSAKRALEAALS